MDVNEELRGRGAGRGGGLVVNQELNLLQK